MSGYDVLAPLSKFSWVGSVYEFPNSRLTLERFDQPPNLYGLPERLGEDDRMELSLVSHWLRFESPEAQTLSPSARINFFLLALWLVVRTRAHVCFYFRFSRSRPTEDNIFTRNLDRFQWVRTHVKSKFKTRI